MNFAKTWRSDIEWQFTCIRLIPLLFNGFTFAILQPSGKTPQQIEAFIWYLDVFFAKLNWFHADSINTGWGFRRKFWEHVFNFSVKNQPIVIKTFFWSFSYFSPYWTLAKLIIIFPGTFKKYLFITSQFSFGFTKVWLPFLNFRFSTEDEPRILSLCKLTTYMTPLAC